jgi:hypothetical protein
MVRVTMIVMAAMAFMAVPASAKTFTAQSGGVTATIAYNKTTTTRLTITRNGASLYDDVPMLEDCGGAPCGPSGFAADPPLRVIDLDGDGEPEVVYSAYTGGAHCCSVADVFQLNGAANGYTATAHNFFDPGFRLKDLDGDGKPEWVTGDDAFAYRFTAYAFSGLPIQILRFGGGAFSDVTAGYPARIQADAKRWLKRYRRARHAKDGTQLGVLAPWAADEYRLGRRAQALSYVRSEARKGFVKAGFAKRLDRFLRKRGY